VYHVQGLKLHSWCRDSLQAGQFGVPTAVEARFFLPVQIGSKAHPASCIMGTSSLSRGVKGLGYGVDYPCPSSTEIKEKVEVSSPPCTWF
jgi:hypothetical protein